MITTINSIKGICNYKNEERSRCESRGVGGQVNLFTKKPEKEKLPLGKLFRSLWGPASLGDPQPSGQ